MQKGVKTRIIRDHPFDDAHHIHNFLDRVFTYDYIGYQNQIAVKTSDGYIVQICPNMNEALELIRKLKASIANNLCSYLNEVDPNHQTNSF